MTLTMDMIGGIYSSRGSITSIKLYNDVAPSTVEIPFVVMSLQKATPIYISNQVSYEKVEVLFTCVALSVADVEVLFGQVSTLASSASPLSTTVKLRTAMRDRKVVKEQIKSRGNAPVWMGTVLVEFWVT